VTVMESTMNYDGYCLRRLIDKWLAPSDTSPIRIKRFQLSDKVYREGRCVCVESTKPGRSLAIFFFRHDDGLWYVFPPAATRPAMRAA
jgi:hypothetical protein